MLLNSLQARILLQHACTEGYAILAANADSPSAMGDCLEAARQCDAPLIIEASLWQLEGASFGRGDAVLGLGRYLADLAILASSDRYREVPVLFHTDHIKGPALRTVLAAAIRGVSMPLTHGSGTLSASTLSVDASELSPDQNVATLLWLTQQAREEGVEVTLEMEDAVDDDYTSIATARQLVGPVEENSPACIWLWAPALGTQHGLTQGSRPFDPALAQEHVSELKKLTGRDIGLALHGTSGLDESLLRQAVRAGVVKVNWSSELLHLRSQAAAIYFRDHVSRVVPGKGDWKKTVMDTGLQTFVGQACLPAIAARIRLLGGENRGVSFRKLIAAVDQRAVD
jgi:fructose/tagatose bisphosphate aldolase